IRQGLAVAELARGRASLGFAQSFHETAGLRFTGQVQADQFNFGGLGATNDGAKGGRFPTVRDGWMAFWAHHMNYWWGPFEEWPDWAAMFVPHAYRNKDVLDAGYGGVVTVVGDYTNGHWAWSPQYLRGSYDNGYAYAIRDGANAILALPRGEEEPQMTPPYSNIIRGLIDVRTDLPRRTAPSVSVESGPFEKLPLSQKRGVVFH